MPPAQQEQAPDIDDAAQQDLASWMDSLMQSIAETDVADPYQLQQCFHDLGLLRDAIARGASLDKHRAAAPSLAHALHGLLQELMRRIEADVVRLDRAGPDLICALCSGLAMCLELHAAKAFGKTQLAALPSLLSQLSAALAGAARAGHVAADTGDVAATLALMTWLTRALKSRLLFPDDKALRGVFADGLACMREWALAPEGSAPRKSTLLNSHTLAMCFVQLNTIRQFALFSIEGESNKVRANRAQLQAVLKALCAMLPDLLNGEGVQLANVCNTLKDYVDAGLLPDSTHGWLMPTITLLLPRIPAVPRRELMQRGGQVLANFANFLRMLLETGLHLKPAFVGCVLAYQQACAWLIGRLADPGFNLGGKLDQSLANLMSFVKAMLRMPASAQNAARASQHLIDIKRAAQGLVELAKRHLLVARAARPSPMSIAGMIAALVEFQAKRVAAPEQCQALMQRLLQAIPDCAGAEWQAESMAVCLRAIVHLQAQSASDAMQGMHAAFTHLLALLGKHRVATEVHQLYCLQALRLGLQQKWMSIDALDMQKALCKLLDWNVQERQKAPGVADLDVAIARLAHREEAMPDAPQASPDEDEPAAPIDTTGRTPPGGTLAALTSAPKVNASTTYRAPIDTGTSTSSKAVKAHASSAASPTKTRRDRDEDDAAFGHDPVHDWFLLAIGHKAGDDPLARMQALAEKHPHLLNKTDAGGHHALHYAIVHGQEDLARWLMAHPQLEPGMPREDFLERLAEDLLDSDKPKRARQLYDEFKALSGNDEAAADEPQNQPAPGDSVSRKKPQRGHARGKRAGKGRAKRDSGRDELETKAVGKNVPVKNAEVMADPSEEYRLGMQYLKGVGVEPDDTLAFKSFVKAANKKHPPAQMMLGILYRNGRGVERNTALANGWLIKAAENGHPEAQRRLALRLLHGQDIDRNESLAIAWFSKAATQGDADAQYELGRIYMESEAEQGNAGRASLLLHEAAERGLAKAQFVLGNMYRNGKGVQKNPALALKWMKCAALQGMAEAQGILGTMYLQGICVERDLHQAIQWLSTSAEQGDAKAQQVLADCYLQGEGVAKNEARALLLHVKAAERGIMESRYSAGVMYRDGLGTEKNPALAVEYFRKCAEQGHAHAQQNLGRMYLLGEGVEKNENLAFQLTMQAALQGLAAAQCNLGTMYLWGNGVEKNPELAGEWLLKAEQQGIPIPWQIKAALQVALRATEDQKH